MRATLEQRATCERSRAKACPIRRAHVRLLGSARRGYAMLWFATGFGAILVALVLGIDVGRLHVAKSSLQSSVDAAARAAMLGLDDSTYVTRAVNAAAENKVDNRTVVIPAADVTIGTWDASTRIFYPNYGTWPNAIRVVGRLGPTNSNTLNGTFAESFGGNPVALTKTAICAGGEITYSWVDGRSNIWYSGLGAPPVGAGQPPREMTVDVYPGQVLRLVSTGGVQDAITEAAQGPDGDAAKISTHALATNGISNITAPETAVVAVFLSDTAPNTTAAPPALNFSTAASRDYTTISPQLKQTFFIGNGQNSTGAYQTIVVPPGATRVFVGVMEGSGFDNNVGSYNTYAASRTTKLQLVR